MRQFPKDFFPTEEEREKHAIHVINLLLSHELFPKYNDFSISTLIGKLPKEERLKAYEIQELVEKILKQNDFADEAVEFKTEIRMTSKGRDLIAAGNYEKFFSEASIEDIREVYDPDKGQSYKIENMDFDSVVDLIKKLAHAEPYESIYTMELQSGIYLRTVLIPIINILNHFDLAIPITIDEWYILTRDLKQPIKQFGDKKLVKFKIGF
jgi:hypothetical protein